MIPKEIITRAIEGGWKAPFRQSSVEHVSERSVLFRNLSGNTHNESLLFEQIALDPSFWQALGKALYETDPKHWQDVEFVMSVGHKDGQPSKTPKRIHRRDWLAHAHRFYDLILTGGDTDKFWEDLLASLTH